MNISDLLLWYNIGYAGSFLIGLVFLVTSIIGVDSGDVSADHDMEQDIEHDAEHDMEQDAEHDVEHDAEHDAHKPIEHEGNVDFHESFMKPVLNALGIGRCPLSIIMMCFLFLFTFFGLSSTILLKTTLESIPLVGILTYVFSLTAGFFLTGRLAGLIGKIMPANETYIRKESSLVGKIGKSVYTFTNAAGYVQVYNDSKTLTEISAVNVDPEHLIQAGDDVLIVDYDAKERIFKVKAAPKELIEF